MLIATGFVHTPEGDAALARAIEETRAREAKLVVVHSMRGGERDEDELVREYDDALQQAETQLAEAGIDFEIRRFARGASPSEDLLECARDEGVDLLVIGIRRRSPVGKLILGSNAQDIILKAECDVLCVKAGG